MKTPRPWLQFCMFWLATATVSGSVLGDEAPDEVSAAARAGLRPFLESIPAADRAAYGFAPVDDLAQAGLGEPFRLYSMAPRDLLNAGPDVTVSSLIRPAGSWFFPVEVGGEPRAVLTVAEMNGAWTAVGIGKAALAREWSEIGRHWAPRGYRPRLVAVYQAAAYFFTLPGLDDYNFTPLSFEGRGFAPGLKSGPGYPELAELSQVMAGLKPVVAENLNAPGR
ncbi:MAG TPA: hypothetical protein PK636_02930 [bacterium]|nr:hypothetical protein [bacterium]HPJ71619.1 hypothetical protein [bacterium]HPQ67155.1 hypothetical protein [bacterium]